jgi:signal transduction histidine kinase/CheY-like chemotaxis protein/ferredoxin
MKDSSLSSLQVIQVDPEKCVLCQACLHVCPVKYCNDSGGEVMQLHHEHCLGCGRCLSACRHGARSAVDDLPLFLRALRRDEQIIVLLSESLAHLFPQHFAAVVSWLKKYAGEYIFDVGLGTRLMTRHYAKWLRDPSGGPYLSSACSVVNQFVQVYRPELISHLVPLANPAAHMMWWIRRNFPELAQATFVQISPCPVNRRSIRGPGSPTYHVLFSSLQECLLRNGEIVDPGGGDALAGTYFARSRELVLPGAPHEILTRWQPQWEGRLAGFEQSENLFEALRHLPTKLPKLKEQGVLLLDWYDCLHRCPTSFFSPLGRLSLSANDAAKKGGAKNASQKGSGKSGPTFDFSDDIPESPAPEELKQEFIRCSFEEGMPEPDPQQLETVFHQMHKYSEEDLRQCRSCGYRSCEMMARAIFHGRNRPENCKHFLETERQMNQRGVSKYQNDLQRIVDERTHSIMEMNIELQREIVQRNRFEKALLDRKQMLQDIIDGSPMPKFVINRDHEVLYWNRALERLTGIRAKNIVGTKDHWKAFYPEPTYCLVDMLVEDMFPLQDPELKKRYVKSDLLEEAYEITDFFSIVGKKGRWLTGRGAPIRDATGKIVGALETVEDVTFRRETELELKASREAAETANQAKSQFLANMSHEIRTPLTAILGFTEMLGDGCPKRCEFSQNFLVGYRQTIEQNARLLLTIIDDILDISRIEAGKFQVTLQPASLLEILQSVRQLLRVRAEEKELDLQFNFEGLIPTVIHTDADRLRQILINLIGNAIKFTARGYVRVTTRMMKLKEEPRLQIDIEDTGKGITPEAIEKLFQPFSQGDNSMSRKYGGTGLGLVISKRLAELLSGDIVIESELGKGSLFRFTFGIGSVSDGELIHPKECLSQCEHVEKPREALVPEKLESHILLAEDGIDNQRFLTIVLRKAGAEVTVVENGKEALEAALESRRGGSPISVILMDMQMPVMDGYRATRELRENGWDGPIIALTAHAMAGDRETCLEAGCDEYLTKPVDRRKLLETIAWMVSDREGESAPSRGGHHSCTSCTASDEGKCLPGEGGVE